MKTGRFIEVSPIKGTARAEVASDEPQPMSSPGAKTVIQLDADCTMDATQWESFVAAVNKQIEREARGGN